jgi:CRP-like cAMP-binding protein
MKSTVTEVSIERLRAFPILAGLAEPTLARLAGGSTELTLEQGQVLIQMNEPGSGLFFLEEGAVAVELHGRTVTLGPGEFFGELSLLVPEAPRSARVRATKPGRCLAVRRSDFEAALESDPAFAAALLRAVARRFVDLISQS